MEKINLSELSNNSIISLFKFLNKIRVKGELRDTNEAICSLLSYIDATSFEEEMISFFKSPDVKAFNEFIRSLQKSC